MRYVPDIAVYAPDGRAVLIAEVKGLANKSPEWAAMLRQQLTAYASAFRAQYVLLALPDHIYVWKDGSDPNLRQPDVVLDPRQVLRQYRVNGESQSHWRESELQMLLADWLDDLARSGPPDPGTEWGNDLARIGLLDSIRGGEVRVGAAA